MAAPAAEAVDSAVAADLAAEAPDVAVLALAVLRRRAVPAAREQPEAAHLVVEEVSVKVVVEAEALVDLLSRQSFSAAMARTIP